MHVSKAHNIALLFNYSVLSGIFREELQTNRGLVLLLGCCHAGVVNTIEHARKRTGVAEFYALIGGTHLGFSDPGQLDATVKALRGYRVHKLCAGHCTGFAASARLLKEFPGQFQPAHVGFFVEI